MKTLTLNVPAFKTVWRIDNILVQSSPVMELTRNTDYPWNRVVFLGSAKHYWKQSKKGSAQVVSLKPGDQHRPQVSFIATIRT